MNIEYKNIDNKFNVNLLKDFFDVAMPGKTKEQCLKIINKSSLIIGAFYEDRLIGISRALDDGVYAFITDVLVHPDYKNKGVGKNLVKLLYGGLINEDVKLIFCNTDKSLIDFYKSSNPEFIYDTDDIVLRIENF